MRTVALLGLWMLLVLYPNPVLLAQSIQRAWMPPLDPASVQAIAATLPDDPAAIEQAVQSRLVRYAVPWQSYGVPWYVPTPTEALATGMGDCQAQAIVLASLLRAKGIPATLAGSFDHLWVEYPGKHANAAENGAVAIVQQKPDGAYQFQLPELFDIHTSWQIERAYFWDAMPLWRRWILVIGWLLIARRGPMLRTLWRGWSYLQRRRVAVGVAP